MAVGANSPMGSWREACTCFGQVVRQRQRARSGTKAYVRWLVDQSETAAWFERAWPPVGSYVLAQGRYSHGPHHTEAVFYVDPGDVEVLPSDANTAWDRHLRREAKRARRRGAGKGQPTRTWPSRDSSSSTR